MFRAEGELRRDAPSILRIGDSVVMVEDPFANVWQIAAYQHAPD